MQTTFHNTISLTGEALKKAVVDASNQETAVLLIYKNTRSSFTPWDIHGMMQRAGKNWPITSVRRAITNLSKTGELIKLSDQKNGEYDKPEHFYKLNFLRYPSKTSQQPKLSNDKNN